MAGSWAGIEAPHVDHLALFLVGCDTIRSTEWGNVAILFKGGKVDDFSRINERMDPPLLSSLVRLSDLRTLWWLFKGLCPSMAN